MSYRANGPIARFVTRGREDGRVDFAIFLANKDSELKPNTVYELSSFDGEVILKEVGLSIMRHPTEAERRGMPCWSQDVSTILRIGSKYLALSEDEYLKLCRD